MINLKIPSWFDSIRAILALLLSLGYCYGVLIVKVPVEQLSGLKDLAMLADTFYFVLKRRPNEENKG